MLKTIWNYKVFIVFLLLILGCLLVNIAVVVHPTRFAGDATSMLVMATAPLRDLGVPYRDYWEYKPPGIFLLVGSWITLFGFSITSLKILQILVLLGTGWLIFLISRKIFSSLYTLLVGGLAIVVLFSPYLNFAFLPAELFGLFFSLAGLASLLYLKRLEWRFFLAAFLIAISGQMKDPFFFTMLAIFPPLIGLLISGQYKSFGRTIIFGLLGFVLAGLLIYAYLFRLGALESYFEVLRFKASVFDIYIWKNFAGFRDEFFYTLWHSKNIVMMFQSEVIIFLQIWLVSFLLTLIPVGKWSWPKVKTTKDSYCLTTPVTSLKFMKLTVNTNVLAVVFYSLGSFLGFSFQGAFDFHNLIQIVPPIFFFWAIIIKSTLDNFLKITRLPKFNFLLFPILIVFLFPKGPYFKSYLLLKDYSPRRFVEQIGSHFRGAEPNTEFEDYLTTKTNQNSCILSVYGWSVGETYYYAQRRPCSRFFLPHLILEDWQKREYREEILRNLPQAIVYARSQTDMNVDLFEREVVNFKQVIDSCYRVDSKYVNLYFPRLVGDQLKNCLQQNIL